MQGLSCDFEQFFLVKNNLLTSVHNDTDDADNADDYKRVNGIAQLNAFSYAKNWQKGYGRFSFFCRLLDVEMSQDIIDHVQAELDGMSREQIIQLINFDTEIDPLLDEAIAIWDTQPHQPQDQQQDHQQAQQQQVHPPIPAEENHIEDYNGDSDSWYDLISG